MMTTADSFQELLRRVAPLPSEVAAAEGHLGTIKARLSEAYSLKKYFTAGSYKRETFIRGKSDVDVLAVVARDDVRWGGSYVTSNTVLDNFKKELEGRFWNTTVYRDVQAIVVQFTDCQVDVVPAFFAGTTDKGWPLYNIPDGAAGWMETSPELHNAYIKQEDDASGGKIRGTARLLKFWRECRDPRVPVSSFLIEMVLASAGICKGIKSYADCVTEVLQNLAARECRALQDPLGISGYLPAVKSESQREGALASVRYSRDHAKDAVQADGWYNLNEARRQWDIVFNGSFPW
jgi:hypothetical protein